ncbi:TniQ family protein [Bosea sp. ASV33]|uniref:TniQ family protein n=1 Tax=Bosea sp. ASV33 TaxID=2795106 RepID=UPI0018EE261C|nr:TniQ family protein [Bosea sp. ASV33]
MPSHSPIQPLGWAHPLQKREPASGFASRLAALNGVDLPTLMVDMAIPQADVFCGTEAAARDIAALGGLGAADTDELVRYTPLRLSANGSTRVTTEHLDRGTVSRAFIRYCPHCIREDIETFKGPEAARPWQRTEWLIENIRSCRTHNVWLVRAAASRGRSAAPDFAATISLAALPNLDTLLRDAVASPPSAFEDWIVARLDGTREPSNGLDDMPLRVGIDFCEALGVSSLHPPRAGVGKLSVIEWARAAEEGFGFASGGENGIEKLLSRLVEQQNMTRGQMGLFDTYGYVVRRLQRTKGDPDYQKPRSVLRRHALEAIPLAPGTDVLGEILDRRRLHTIHTASLEAGVNVRAIRTLLVRKGLYTADEAADLTNHRIKLSVEEFEREIRRLGDAVNAETVMQITGIPRKHLTSLVSLEFLPSLTDSNNIERAKHRFARDDVDALMERLFNGAEPVTSPTSRQMTIQRARLSALATLDDLLRWVHDGTLRWKGRLGNELRYENLLVNADEITSLVRSNREITGIHYDSVDQFIPGLRRTSAISLARQGAFETVEEFGSRSRRAVSALTPESVQAFQERYITLVELCRVGGFAPKRGVNRMRAAGVDPAFSYETTLVMIYPRAAALGAVLTGPRKS